MIKCILLEIKKENISELFEELLIKELLFFLISVIV